MAALFACGCIDLDELSRRFDAGSRDLAGADLAGQDLSAMGDMNVMSPGDMAPPPCTVGASAGIFAGTRPNPDEGIAIASSGGGTFWVALVDVSDGATSTAAVAHLGRLESITDFRPGGTLAAPVGTTNKLADVSHVRIGKSVSGNAYLAFLVEGRDEVDWTQTDPGGVLTVSKAVDCSSAAGNDVVGAPAGTGGATLVLGAACKSSGELFYYGTDVSMPAVPEPTVAIDDIRILSTPMWMTATIVATSPSVDFGTSVSTTTYSPMTPGFTKVDEELTGIAGDLDVAGTVILAGIAADQKLHVVRVVGTSAQLYAKPDVVPSGTTVGVATGQKSTLIVYELGGSVYGLKVQGTDALVGPFLIADHAARPQVASDPAGSTFFVTYTSTLGAVPAGTVAAVTCP